MANEEKTESSYSFEPMRLKRMNKAEQMPSQLDHQACSKWKICRCTPNLKGVGKVILYVISRL